MKVEHSLARFGIIPLWGSRHPLARDVTLSPLSKVVGVGLKNKSPPPLRIGKHCEVYKGFPLRMVNLIAERL